MGSSGNAFRTAPKALGSAKPFPPRSGPECPMTGRPQLPADGVGRPQPFVAHEEPFGRTVELDATGALVLGEIPNVGGVPLAGEQQDVGTDERENRRSVPGHVAGPAVEHHQLFTHTGFNLPFGPLPFARSRIRGQGLPEVRTPLVGNVQVDDDHLVHRGLCHRTQKVVDGSRHIADRHLLLPAVLPDLVSFLGSNTLLRTLIDVDVGVDSDWFGHWWRLLSDWKPR